ncbi:MULTISPECIES: nickel/cobalt transporter [Bradyrhizobium]|nr:nickel/cobalt transporter [Bradyrhizobium elkanii]NWL40847.1 nickel/cobalt transporter [Bradyrhizobium elkanii]NWL70593.1 nickel/cobalt transporter [Bradyrhizobium elkanii]RYM28264.1 nickel/cobalt transporter [Bradyrhizobium elkanii]UQD80476.1 nickel/cobalt transporter [Bradyrhizobium elkanii USDA 76]WLA41404.1 nickel/cobalt transporter [Bradyrhizobium elkanii]
MPMTPIVSRMTRGLAVSAAVLAAFALLDGAVHALLAQNPFGAPRAAEPQGGLVGWLLAKQSEFYREISQTIRAAKSDGSAVWTLLVISFAYGIFHAAGPGHGKAVISSYMVANRETARRGIVLSFASALMQSVVAVLIVGICAWLLNATAKTMCGAEKAVEIASYALIAAFGARLVWVKGGGFFRALQAPGPALAMAGAHQHDHDHHDHDHHDHGHDHHHRHAHDDHGHHHDHGPEHGHDAQHVHDEHCGHSHGPTPAELAGPGGWRRGLGAILTVGIRPCSGAILVLVFALAQGLFWAGIAATFVMGLGTAITVAAIALVAVSARGVAERLSAARDGGGMVIMRGLEFAAAGLVLLFGLGLLFGYVAAERATCL